VDEPFLVDGISLRTGVSIGIALFPDDDLDLSGLLRKADIAMYRAKTLSTGHTSTASLTIPTTRRGYSWWTHYESQ